MATTNADADSHGTPPEAGTGEELRLQTAANQLAPASVNNAFESLNPARLLDTRAGGGTIDGQFAATGPIDAGSSLDLVVVGRGGVPGLGVGAVAINVTAVTPTGNGFLTVWPTGAARPNASNLNFVAGDVVPNLVVVRVGAAGKVSIFNETGATHLLVDVVGWFADNAGLQPLVPARLLDTRPGTATIDGVAAGAGAVAGNSTTTLTVTGRGGVPATGVSAVVLNVTVTAPTDGGFITVWPDGEGRPNASNLNFVPGQTVANLVITKVGVAGRVDLYNSSGATHLIADVMGWFGADSELHSLSPARLLDTRPNSATIDGEYAGVGQLGPNSTESLVVTGRGGVPDTGVEAVVLNVTVTAPSTSSFLTVWPAFFTRPNASSLNFVKGKTVANLVIAQVGGAGAVSFYNSAGTTHIIADVVGWLPPNDPLSLTEASIKPGVAGQAYSNVIGLTGSQGPYGFSATGLAPGLNIAGTTLSGTPSVAGTTSTILSTTDRFGRGGTATLPHNIFPASSGFVAVTPTTVLDTFTEPTAMSAGQVRSFLVGGVGGVPASGVVPVLNISAVPYADGFMSLFPTGASQPLVSNLALKAFIPNADIAVVSLGSGGQVSLYTGSSADAHVQVIGYMPTGGAFTDSSPVRLLDTRLTSSAFAAGEQRDITVAGVAGVPSGPGGATDVLAIVTSVSATASGSLTIWETGGTAPTAPSVRFSRSPFAQFVILHLGTGGAVTIKNTSTSTSTHLLVDIYGYFT